MLQRSWRTAFPNARPARGRPQAGQRFLLFISTLAVRTNQRVCLRLFFRHERAAFRTFFIHRLVPKYLITVRISAAAVKNLTFFALSYHDIITALWTLDVQLFLYRHRRLAFGITGACDKLTESAMLCLLYTSRCV